MVFDKTKAMRNAERYLAQGKIQSAIGEYKQVVANDPKDFGTLNMLGDLYAKSAETQQAIKCYTSVAEYYSKQGFAQKAIAVYNKISKLQPGSIEISAKLAELYKFKGSISEARSHYKTVAEHYEREGKKIEALEVRKEIASLDPTDTTIHLNLAAAYVDENEPDLAVESFIEAGNRLARKAMHSEAVSAFEKALEITPTNSEALAAFIQSHFALGTAAIATEKLEAIHSADSHNRDVLQLLIDCYLEVGRTDEAEKAIIGLVEKEPANYPRLVELARIYLKNENVESSSRVMAMASEHLLLAEKADEFQSLLTDILALDPEQLEALRQRAKLSAWQRDEAGMHESLAQLAKVAKARESVDDERHALAQLVMIAPHEVEYADRLKEINEQFGFDNSDPGENLFDAQFMKAAKGEEPELETFAPEAVDPPENGFDIDTAVYEDFAIVAGTTAPTIEVVEPESDELQAASPTYEDDGGDDDQARLAREVDSIRFYIDSGYLELAEKAISELRAEFGSKAEINDLAAYLQQKQAPEEESSAHQSVDLPVEPSKPVEISTNGNHANVSAGLGIDDLRSELGIDEADSTSDSDYDTHYHTAVAYQEMGLLDEAIKEFQDAVGLVQPNDPTRRFFQCANLLGHCFMQKSMPNLALTWYQRALETPGLGDEEKQGIWYELALAYEAEGDLENAGRYFEQVYAENIDFRDVSQRVKNIAVSN